MKDHKRMTMEELVAELERHRPSTGLAAGDEDLVHELQVHQAELEAQNIELKSAHERLEEAASQYADLYDFAPVGYADLDPLGRIRRINLTGSAMFGVERSKLSNRSLVTLLRDEGAKSAFLAHLERCRGGAPKVTSELNIGASPGLNVQIESVPVVSENETRYRTAFTDITSLKKAQEEKELMHSRLLQAQKMEVIGRLAAGVSHDFNNLLTVIISYCDLALVEAGSIPRDYMEQISAAAEKAQNLTRQLLIFSRGQPVKMSELDINAAVSGMIPMLSTLIGGRMTIRADLPGGLPLVAADKSNIEQLVMNLVVNARDAMPEGGDIAIATWTSLVNEKTAEPKGRPPGRYVVIAVKDTGVGIGASDLQHIFEPFFSTKSHGQGIGLGLSVVSNIVSDHKGWIEVESAKGKGTEFKVFFPALSSGEAASHEKTTIMSATIGNGERILVIEDEASLRRSVALVLAKNGYRVFEAEGAEEAMKDFEREGGRFDLIFSDVVLKGKSGIEFVEDLRKKGLNPNVLFTSGYLDVESQWPVIQENGYRLIKKPYDIFSLLKAVKESISTARAGA